MYLRGQLRVQAAADMKRSDFAKMLSNTLDTGYEAEDASFFEKLVAIIVVVVSVIVGFILAVPTGGISFKSAAIGLSAAGAILGGGMMALSAFGGLSAMGLVKQIGKIAAVVGLVAMVTGVIAAIQNAMKNVAVKALAEQGIQNATATQITNQLNSMTMSDIVSSVVSDAVEGAISKVTEPFRFLTDKGIQLSVSSIMTALESTLKLAQQGINMYADHENEKLNKDMEKLQKEYEEIKEDLDSSRRLADPLYVLLQSTENLTTYDAIQFMEIKWNTQHSPQGHFDEFHAERSIK